MSALISDFKQQLSVLLKGNILAQLLPILALPIVSRIYSVEEFALFTFCLTSCQLLSIVASFRYELAILLPDSDKDAQAIVKLCSYLIVVSQLFLGLLMLFFAKLIEQASGIPQLAYWLWTVPVTSAAMAFYQVQSYYATRINNLASVSRSKVYQAVSQTSSRIGFGFLSFGNLGLLLSNFLGILLSFFAFKSTAKAHVTPDLVIKQAKRYRNFPKYAVLDGVLNAIAIQIPVYLFGKFYGVASVGQFGMALRIITLPAAFIALSVGQSYYKSITATKDSKAIADLSNTLLVSLAKLALVPLILTICFGELLFSFVLGVEWEQAGHFAVVLAPWVFMSFVFSPLSFLFDALEKQKFVLYYSALNFAVRLTLMVVLFKLGYNANVNLLVFSISGIVLWIWFFLVLCKSLNLAWWQLAKKIIALPLLLVVLLAWLKYFIF